MGILSLSILCEKSLVLSSTLQISAALSKQSTVPPRRKSSRNSKSISGKIDAEIPRGRQRLERRLVIPVFEIHADWSWHLWSLLGPSDHHIIDDLERIGNVH